MTGCVLARAVRLWRSRRCWLRVALSCCVVCDVCVKWAYTCIDTYVCVCTDTCSDFGSISHVRCTYTIKDVSTISHLRCANTCAYFFQLFFNSDLPSIYLIRSVDGLFLLLSFHGGIFSSIVAEKEDNWKVVCKERRYIRPVGSAVGGVCRYGLLYRIINLHVHILRVKTFIV